MKRILFILIFTLSLSSCQSSFDTASAVMDKLRPPNGTVYKNGSDISQAEYISSEELSFLYYGENTALNELDRISSYCIYMSRQKRVSELHIIEARYQSDVESIKRMLKSRADFLSELRINPNPSDWFCDTKVEYEIFSKGRFVFLIVGNTEQRIKSIESLF